MEQEDESEMYDTRSSTSEGNNMDIGKTIKEESPEQSVSVSNPLNGIVDFPFIVTTTDKGNTMIVTDSQAPGYRHHWSVHTRRPHKSESIGVYFNERYACIKCKQQSRDTNASMFAPCLSAVQLPSGELILKTHPWTGIRPHICPGVPVDESDACLLLRRKRQDIVKLKVDPKDAFDELMHEVSNMPGWSEDKKERVRQVIGSRKRNDRTFNRCRLKGRRAKEGEATSESKDDEVQKLSGGNDPMTALVSELAAEANPGPDLQCRTHPEVSATVSIAESSSTLVQSWIENEMFNFNNNDDGLVKTEALFSSLDNSFSTPPVLDPNINSQLGIYSIFPPAKLSLSTFDNKQNRLLEMGSTSTLPNNGFPANSNVSNRTSNKRPFAFDNYPQRRIALMFLYCGWEYEGLVAQPDLQNTVEEHIFGALVKTCLIKDRDSCQWTRCGRTDKGVSAFKQVAAVNVRSNDAKAEGVFWSIDSDPALRVQNTAEHNFVKILNGVLPRMIRVLAWSPVHRDFNARFNCDYRLYTYIFPRSNIDLKAIKDACKRLVGSHDFRNFCHIDNNKNRLEMSYVREIFDADVDVLSKDDDEKYSLLRLTVKASGFLWHQIRCIVTVLYEIGSRRETPQLIDDLLTIEKCPARPQYGLANELPLCLFDCSYPEENLKWNFDQQVLSNVLENLQKLWAELQVKAAMVKSMITGLSPLIDASNTSTTGLDIFTTAHAQTKNYVRMMKRPKCQSLEERIEKNVKKMKRDFE